MDLLGQQTRKVDTTRVILSLDNAFISVEIISSWISGVSMKCLFNFWEWNGFCFVTWLEYLREISAAKWYNFFLLLLLWYILDKNLCLQLLSAAKVVKLIVKWFITLLQIFGFAFTVSEGTD